MAEIGVPIRRIIAVPIESPITAPEGPRRKEIIPDRIPEKVPEKEPV